MYLYSAFFVVLYIQGAHASITQFHLQLHQFLSLPRKRLPDGASPDWGCAYLIAAYYSFIYPEKMKGWVGLVGWPTAHGLPTSVVIPSDAGRAQDRLSLLVRDQLSTTVPRNQQCVMRVMSMSAYHSQCEWCDEYRNVARVRGSSSKRWKARTSRSSSRPSASSWPTSRVSRSPREAASPSIRSTSSSDITSNHFFTDITNTSMHLAWTVSKIEK